MAESTEEGAFEAARVSIPGWRGYFADLYGQIWSRKSGEWRRLKLSPLKKGHLKVELFRDGQQSTQLVHRLVCTTFHGAPVGRKVTRHLDDNPANNRPRNLAWGTHKENSEDMVRHGRSTVGSRNPAAKLTEDNVREIRARRANGESNGAVAARFNISKSNVSFIYNRVAWRHI